MNANSLAVKQSNQTFVVLNNTLLRNKTKIAILSKQNTKWLLYSIINI